MWGSGNGRSFMWQHGCVHVYVAIRANGSGWMKEEREGLISSSKTESARTEVALDRNDRVYFQLS